MELDKPYIMKLHKVSKSIYWLDLLSCVVFGWGLYFVTIYFDNLFIELPAFIIGTIFIYRGQLFIHEVVHQRKNIKGFALAYEVFFGYPNSFPSYIHDPHLAHHGKKTYGTAEDPEYAPHINNSWPKMLQPLFFSFLLPIFSTLRFCFLPPFMLFFPFSWKKKIYHCASTLIVDTTYKRPMRSRGEVSTMLKHDLICSLYRWFFIYALFTGLLPMKGLWVWLGMIYFASVLNMYRTKVAHYYLGDGTPMNSDEQLLDSVTVSGSFLSEIWAPVGLRYHSGHHLYPVMPYHNLGKLHRYLTSENNKEHLYNQTVFPSFLKAFFYFLK